MSSIPITAYRDNVESPEAGPSRPSRFHDRIRDELPTSSDSEFQRATTDSDSDTESSWSSMSLSSLKEELEKIRRETRTQFEQQMQVASTAFPAQDVQAVNGRVDLSWAFVTIIQDFQQGDFITAKKELRRAKALAERLKDKHAIARYFYWFGRIAFVQENLHKAYFHFSQALPDLNGQISSEADDVELFLALCSPNITPQYGRRLIYEHAQAILENSSPEMSSNDDDPSRGSTKPKSLKRKREMHDVSIILRQAQKPSTCYERYQNSNQGRRRLHPSLGRTVVWASQNADDLDRTRYSNIQKTNIFDDTQTGSPKLESSAGQADSATETAKHTRFSELSIEKRKFKFRFYHIGLSGLRSRRMDIFARQVGEPTLSIEEGKELDDAMRDERITMAYLMLEKEFLAEQAKFPGIAPSCQDDEETNRISDTDSTSYTGNTDTTASKGDDSESIIFG